MSKTGVSHSRARRRSAPCLLIGWQQRRALPNSEHSLEHLAKMTVDQNQKIDAEVNACGLHCPLPVLRLKKALSSLQSGQIVKVRVTDPQSVRDFAAFAKQAGHQMIEVRAGWGVECVDSKIMMQITAWLPWLQTLA